MRIKEGFNLHKVADHWVAEPEGNATTDNKYIIKLNQSAVLLWKELEKGVDSVAELAEALLQVYEIEYETALRDSEELTDLLGEIGLLDV